jgi:hypothetical protein
MPNWAYCELYISGNETNNVLTLIRGKTPFDFEKIIPTPKKFLKDDRWYNWRTKHWGTKWNTERVDIIITGPKSAMLYFNTAWSPPIPIIAELSKKFKKVRFRLYSWEGGNSYKTVSKFYWGRPYVDKCDQYNGSRGG